MIEQVFDERKSSSHLAEGRVYDDSIAERGSQFHCQFIRAIRYVRQIEYVGIFGKILSGTISRFIGTYWRGKIIEGLFREKTENLDID